MKIENAIKLDVVDLAYLINQAGEGIPKYLWSELANSTEREGSNFKL